jgi:peptide/nickel transport system permease protein
MTGVVLASALAPLLTASDPTAQDTSRRLLGPDLGSAHALGTDALGRDLLSRILFGGRTSLVVSAAACLVAALVGTTVGMVSGYREGKVGALIMGIADAQLAFPFMLLAIAFVSTIGSSLGNVVLILALTSWVVFARTTNALALQLKNREFVLASVSVGASSGRILWTHLRPHVIPVVIVLATLQAARVILFESALSFLGMGVPSATPTWGSMLSDSRAYMVTAPWMSIFPGLAIMLTVLGATFVGDWLRDVIDPRASGRL